jgi:hypothetical protein
MGPGRAGAYTHDWIENLFGLNIHSANRIVPDWQQLEVGDGRVGAVTGSRALAIGLRTEAPPRDRKRARFGRTWVRRPGCRSVLQLGVSACPRRTVNQDARFAGLLLRATDVLKIPARPSLCSPRSGRRGHGPIR